jgi:AcrR family transcriptional regulator
VAVVSTPGEQPTTRDERRKRTEAAILEAARALFAETGYERATIRAVAGAAGVDPALVMQHFGSKEGLFAAAARWSDDAQTVMTASREQVPAAALHDMIEKFEGASDREAAVALMRNCLTHPEASRIMRDEVMCDRATPSPGHRRRGGGAAGGPARRLHDRPRHGALRARAPGLATASREDVVRLMEPALRALVDPPD